MSDALPFWMPFHPADYLRDTSHLATVEHGAYFLLILHYWQHGGLPDDDRALARIVRLPLSSWRRMRAVIAPLFHGDGPWRHKRIDAELAKATTIMERRKEAASKAGTMSAIARERNRKTGNAASTSRSTSRAPDAHAASTPRAHNNKDITTNLSGAARARDTEQAADETAESFQQGGGSTPKTSTELAAAPAGFAEATPHEPNQKVGSVGSPELELAMKRKGWIA